MRKSRKHVLPVFALLVASVPVFSQTALQRANELCATIQQQVAAEKDKSFQMSRAGDCHFKIDTGYILLVTHEKQSLRIVMGFNAVLLNGDASALWLHLSAFDNLSYAAL
jgi:hypothetical protein